MYIWMRKHRRTRWSVRLFVVLNLVVSWGALAGTEVVAPLPTIYWVISSFTSTPKSLGPYLSGDEACVDMGCIGPIYMYRFNQAGNLGEGRCSQNGGDCGGIFSYMKCPIPKVNPQWGYVLNWQTAMCKRTVPDTLTITLSGGNEIEPSSSSSIEILPVIATVKDQSTGQPPTTPVNVKVSLKVDPTSGGHDHGDSTRPRGGIADVEKCLSDDTCKEWTLPANNGVVEFNFKAPEASGKHTITATCVGCTNTATKPVDVKVNGLAQIPASSFYALNEANGDVIGAVEGWHTDNHYLTPEASTILMRIAVNYRFSPRFYLRNSATGQVLLPPVLHLNDASLKWGGVYDICARPDACATTGIVSWLKPHAEHRRGTVIDMRTNTKSGAIPQVNKLKFKNYLTERNISHKDEDAGTANEHLHVRLMGRKE